MARSRHAIDGHVQPHRLVHEEPARVRLACLYMLTDVSLQISLATVTS